MAPGAVFPATLLALLPLLLQEAPPAASPPVPPPSPVAVVVAAVAKEAVANAALPEKERVSGDALFDLYLRAAAKASGGDRRSFLLGLAHAVDPKRTLAKLNLTQKEYAGVETDAERAARLAALGKPSLRGRPDHVLHFTVAAALTVFHSADVAETMALVKEQMDAMSPKGTGFSFADLLADYAGIRFAEWLGDPKEGAARVKALAGEFTGTAFMPDASAETEGLMQAAFEEKFGDFQDARFLAEKKRMRGLVADLKVYEVKAEGK